jgi:hypothetical protein
MFMKPTRTKGKTAMMSAGSWQWQKLYNPFVTALLRSPLHSLLAAHTMLLTVTGRKGGKRYTFPVSYVREGETLLVISQRDRSWWKNLRIITGLSQVIHRTGHESERGSFAGRCEHCDSPVSTKATLVTFS